ncbi:hypothetical protein IGI53_003007 [Enterococcus sp. DIV0788_1]
MMQKISNSVVVFVLFGILFLVWAVLWDHKFYLYFSSVICFFYAFRNYSDKKST